MAYPKNDDAGYYEMNGGEAVFDGCTWYGENFDTVAHIEPCYGGAISWTGRCRQRQHETVEGRPPRPPLTPGSEFDTGGWQRLRVPLP